MQMDGRTDGRETDRQERAQKHIRYFMYQYVEHETILGPAPTAHLSTVHETQEKQRFFKAIQH
jgi:hypothetical protein